MFLECGPLHVKDISPIPARPKTVEKLPPAFLINSDVSDSPLVINAAFALSPNFNPSIIPAPIAIIFLTAPAIEAPSGSSFG